MKICSFLWVYYGYPTSAYEGVNVEEMRYKCGSMLAKRDGNSVHPDIVAGVPDSGIAHAIGYAHVGVYLINGPAPLCPPTRTRGTLLPG